MLPSIIRSPSYLANLADWKIRQPSVCPSSPPCHVGNSSIQQESERVLVFRSLGDGDAAAVLYTFSTSLTFWRAQNRRQSQGAASSGFDRPIAYKGSLTDVIALDDYSESCDCTPSQLRGIRNYSCGDKFSLKLPSISRWCTQRCSQTSHPP